MPVPVTLTITNGSDIQQAGEVIQSMASEAGFDVKIKAMEFASSLQAAYAGDFQAYLIGWSGRADPDGNMWQMLHTGGTFNYGHYSNADVDKALDDARTVAAVDQRRAFYAKVWEQERKDLPLIYLWTGKNIVGMKKALIGIPAGAGRADPAAGDADAVGRALHGTEWAAIAPTAAVYATAKVACRACPSHRRAPPDRRFPASAVVRCRRWS